MKLNPLIIAFVLTLVSIQLTAQNFKKITTSCDLNYHEGDTLTIKGKFSSCMEYSSFETIKTDSCSSSFQMELNFNEISENQKLTSNFHKLSGRCGGYFNLTLTGILKKESKNGYGHLGTNNTEFVVIAVEKIGNLKFSKLE
ncbi:hypothetical protein [Flammeovirga agarivorans]|uniref:Lipoprotein n=1 Tax=Flammeovirga agarivorans TaxID=2726742 RepID=A0A7X8SJQ5_9BACT|nr:hypothetical protein [Flammeovirga agarivorans]NLR91388.1 hypothetical protein [Flammeovirga agarivorans]